MLQHIIDHMLQHVDEHVATCLQHVQHVENMIIMFGISDGNFTGSEMTDDFERILSNFDLQEIDGSMLSIPSMPIDGFPSIISMVIDDARIA